jgi:hypothetical protein
MIAARSKLLKLAVLGTAASVAVVAGGGKLADNVA